VSRLDDARDLAERGYSVFPGRGKVPATAHGLKDASRDERTILHMWDGRPEANVLINLERSEAWVLDIDPKNGADPDFVIVSLGLDLGEFVIVRTGEHDGVRGAHVWFRGHEPTRKLAMPGVEIRGDGAYVLAPGSTHPSGLLYVGELPPAAELPEAPESVRRLLREAKARPTTSRVQESIPAGMRNDTLTRLAGSMRRPGMSEDAILAALREENRARCTPPLDDDEVKTIAHSVARYKPAADATTDPPAAPLVKRSTWPTRPADAIFYGLAGDVVRTLSPHSEAHPMALLGQFLVAFGSAIGRGPGLQVEGDFHATNEYLVLVGDTAKARKGTGRGRVMQLMRRVDPEWASERQCSGLVSGEGLIWEVRDPITRRRKPRKGEGAHADEDGLIEELEDAGIEDKRVLVTEAEFAAVLAVIRRDGNTLSPIVRDLWDHGNARTMAKGAPARTTGAHVSIIGHITSEELRRGLTATERANGFANRFLFVCVRRVRSLAFGGNLDERDLDFLAKRIGEALGFAGDVAGSLAWGAEAARLWESVYPGLSEGRGGMFGAIVARSEAHVIRLAILYALLDRKRTIERSHVEAALALWDYAERSAAHIFGGVAGDPLADRFLSLIQEAGDDGIDRSALRDSVSGKLSAARLDAALGYLERCLAAERVTVQTGGRPAERWFVKRVGKPRSGSESRVIDPEWDLSTPSVELPFDEPTRAEEARAEDVIERHEDDES
jgi:bifunctional DNA primase/polymerase-like protein/primase-like protein/uncharacterized protein DUF3987